MKQTESVGSTDDAVAAIIMNVDLVLDHTDAGYLFVTSSAGFKTWPKSTQSAFRAFVLKAKELKSAILAKYNSLDAKEKASVDLFRQGELNDEEVEAEIIKEILPFLERHGNDYQNKKLAAISALENYLNH